MSWTVIAWSKILLFPDWPRVFWRKNWLQTAFAEVKSSKQFFVNVITMIIIVYRYIFQESFTVKYEHQKGRNRAYIAFI